MTNRPIPLAEVQYLRAARYTATRVLEAAGVDWHVREVDAIAPGRVVLDVGPAEGKGVRIDWVRSPPAESGSNPTGAAWVARVRRSPDALAIDTATVPADLRARVTRICSALASLSSGLAIPAGLAPAKRESVIMIPDCFEPWMRGWLGEDDRLADGWRLGSTRRLDGAMWITFVHRDCADTADVGLALRDDARPAAVRLRSLDVLYEGRVGPGLVGAMPGGVGRLLRALGIDLLDIEETTTFVDPAGEPLRRLAQTGAADVALGTGEGTVDASAGGSGRTAVGPADTLSLGIGVSAPCGQACAFCSLSPSDRTYMASDVTPHVQGFERDMEWAASLGVRTLRLNGVDPLRAPYLFELAAKARELRFDTIEIYSPGTALSDPDFAARFVQAMPSRYDFKLPIYGATASTHDKLVGRTGAFVELIAGVRNLARLMGPGGTVSFETVLMAGNAEGMGELSDLVWELCTGLGRDLQRVTQGVSTDDFPANVDRAQAMQSGACWRLHLPHPSGPRASEVYPRVALRMTDALAAIYPTNQPPIGNLDLGEIMLCVALAHQRRSGHSLLSVERLRRRRARLAGALYRAMPTVHSNGVHRVMTAVDTVACRHKARCALAVACPGELYPEYALLFGDGELEPVSREDVSSLADGAKMLNALDELARRPTSTED